MSTARPDFGIAEGLTENFFSEVGLAEDNYDPWSPRDPAAGRKKVASVTGQARQRLEAEGMRSTGPRWPKPGEAHRGVQPGEWRKDGRVDETGHLPEDCPVRPLGYDGENYSFVDTKGQVFNTGTAAMGVERIQKLFSGHEDFLCFGWPAHDKKGRVTGFKAEEVRRDLYAACDRRGPWSMTDMVRGRGAWIASTGEFVVHCGEWLWRGGRLEPTGEVGEHFYVRRPNAMLPAEKLDGDNPAVEIFKALRTWNFERGDTDAMLLLGWIGVALMGAALDWRPSVFIVGDAGTGKSELVGKNGLLRSILGRYMVATTNASEAGLYQVIGHDSLPIAIDEMEGEDGVEQAQKIIKMARDAASGSVRIRGGADHKGVEFQAQSVFLFSAINPPPIPPASLSRLAVLQLKPLKSVSGRAPRLEAAATVGPRLLRRIVERWTDYPKIYEAYRDVLREAGHDSRGQNTFGTFLAAGHLLLGDEGMSDLGLPFETLDHWGGELAAELAPELADKKPAWEDFLDRLMTTPIANWEHGVKQTPGQVIEQLETGDIEFAPAQKRLAAADLGLMQRGDIGPGYGLAIPISSKVIGVAMLDTSFGDRGGNGAWSWALRRAPERVVRKTIISATGKPTSRASVAGAQRRCLFVSLRDLEIARAEDTS